MPLEGDFICKTCDRPLKARAAGDHHRRGHEVWRLEAGEMTDRYGEKDQGAAAAVAKARALTSDGGGT